MNRLAQFLHYAQKVFALKTRLRAIRDRRPFAVVPTFPVVLSLVLGVILRIGSYLDLAQQTQRRRWRHRCGLKDPVGDDLFGYVAERLYLEDLRQQLVGTAKTLKQNKALESCKINGLLFLSLDANEHFASRSRCCPYCCQRHVQMLEPDGQKREVIEYYHRYVFAQINGPKLNVVLDVEPILPGEEECAAALRLLGRARRLYGPRFFDAISADGWYAKGPFLRAVEKLGWSWVVVLKREDMDVYKEAQTLSHGQAPRLAFEDQERKRQVQLWEVKDLPLSDGYGQSVRVVRSEERWVENRVRGGQKQSHPRSTQWVWAASAQLDGYGASLIYHAGHRRWGIENKAFNELTQHYHLEHCYHHEPAAMLAQMLILMLGFVLFSAYAVLHSQAMRLGQITMKALAHDMDLALEADLPWDLWFHSG